MGIITGIPKMAINVLLLSTFEAIEEIIVKVVEKATEPAKTLRKNRDLSCTGFPKTIE